MPRFSNSCLVGALIPSGHDIVALVPGASLCSRACRAKAEQTASGSAFWWHKRTMCSAMRAEVDRDRRNPFQVVLALMGIVDTGRLSASRGACRSELLLELSLKLFHPLFRALFLSSQDSYPRSEQFLSLLQFRKNRLSLGLQ